MLITSACGSEPGDTSSEPAAPSTSKYVTALVESVEIEKVAAKPPNSTMVVMSGLSNGCETFDSYSLERDGDTFNLTVTNLTTAGPGVACAAVYGTVTTSIPIDDGVDACHNYAVKVNGEPRQVTSSCPAIGAGPTDEPARQMVRVPAPIDSASILVGESFPEQYFLSVTSGLPNGCVEFDGYTVERGNLEFTVTVNNREPEDGNVPCTDDYRTVTTSIRLGSGHDLEPDTEYAVLIHGRVVKFTTEPGASSIEQPGDATPPTPVDQPSEDQPVKLSEPLRLEIGDTAVIEAGGFAIVMAEVTEDSRCPADVTCVWAGTAKVRIEVRNPGDKSESGIGDLILQLGKIDPEVDNVTGLSGNYLFELVELEPRPLSTVQIDPSEYIAILTVSKR